MTQIKLLSRTAILVFALALALVSLSGYFLRARSQEYSDGFEDDGRPGQRVEGGSRDGNCPDTTDSKLTALMPGSSSGRTVNPHPTFWFYVPFSARNNISGEFVLQDENRRNIDGYPKAFSLREETGIVGFRHAAPKPLAADTRYLWYFKLYCNPQKNTYVYVNGSVRVVPSSPELTGQLSRENLDYIAYQESQIWFDTLTDLALRRLEEDNAKLRQDWSELLRIVGLEDLEDKPIVGELD